MEETQNFTEDCQFLTRSPTGAMVMHRHACSCPTLSSSVDPWVLITVALCPVSSATSSAVGPAHVLERITRISESRIALRKEFALLTCSC